MRRKARTIVKYADRDHRVRPVCLYPDRCGGEIYCVLHQIAQAVNNFRPAQDRGLVGGVPGIRAEGKGKRLAAHPVRFGGFFKYRHQGGLAQMQIVFARPPHVAQNIAAPVGLIADQRGILGQIGLVLQFIPQLAAGQFDRGKGRAQFMRGSGNYAAKIGQLLFARQRHLSGGQGVCHRMDLGRDAAGIGGREHNRDHQRDPDAEDKDARKLKHAPILSDQRQVKQRQPRRQPNGCTTKHDGRPQAQRRGRDGHRPQQQQRKRIMQPARQEQQKGQLHQIEQHHQQVFILRQTLVFGKHQNGDQIADHRHANREIAQPQFQLQAKDALRDGDRRQLPRNRHPPQHDHRAQADPVGTRALAQAFTHGNVSGLRHRRTFSKCRLR